MAAAHSDLLLVLHMGQLHILLLGGRWRLLQMTANHELVHEDSRNGAQEWRDDGHPPPVPTSREDFRAPSSNGSEKARAEVPSRVDSIARVEAHGGANDQDHKAYGEGLQASGDRVVVGVNNGQHTHDKGGCAYELVKEAIDHVQVSRGVGGKDASCSIGARDYKLIVGEAQDCIIVQPKNYPSTQEGSQRLSKGVDWQLDPGLTSQEAHGKGHSRIQVGPRDLSSDEDAQCDSKAKGQVDGEETTMSAPAEHHLGH